MNDHSWHLVDKFDFGHIHDFNLDFNVLLIDILGSLLYLHDYLCPIGSPLYKFIINLKEVLTMLLVGVRNVRYNRKSDNQLIEGAEIHVTEPMPENQGRGIKCDKFFVSENVLRENPALVINKQYKFFYNKYGRIDSWVVSEDN